MQRINLYQEQFRRHRDPTDAAHLALWLLLAVIVLALFSAVLAWRAGEAQDQLARLEGEREQATTRLSELRDQLASAQAADDGAIDERLRELRAELTAKRRLLDYLASGPLAERNGFSPYLRDLARRTIEGVWLERIVLQQGGQRLHLDGHATAPEQVPRLMAALGDAPAYQGHRFRTVEIRRPEEAPGQLDFVVASEPPASKSRSGRGDR